MNNQKLITLNGESVQKKGFPDVSKLSDFDAGLIFLKMASEFKPGLKFGDFIQRPGLHGWLTNFTKSVTNIVGKTVEGVGDVLKNTGDYIGEKAGSTIRLASDQDVQQAVIRAASAYATGGQSLAVESVLSNIGGTPSNNPVTVAGQGFKENYAAIMGPGGINPMYLMAGMGGLILVVLLTQRK